ncbi:MAG TPA: metalloregulator ArsR/SmtB family transcription factor [Candidatus Binatia bacterium]|nr:metalloregulator ArsR/SmtB family transcription factor [Candidatus Binatia bacterium]
MQRCCAPARAADFDAEPAAALFKALSDPHRLSILATLARARGEVCVCDFTGVLPLNQPTVSHHLRILREAELIAGERRGTWVYYRLAEGARQRLDAALASLFLRKVTA